MTLRALVVDDERLARVALSSLLAEHADIAVVGQASSVATAVQLIEDCDPDLVFLDVRMRDGTGFDVLQRTAVRGQVVFVTAYGEYAVEAFEVAAADYLVKPVARHHLRRATDRIRERIGAAGPAEIVSFPLGPDRDSGPSGKLELTNRVALQRGANVAVARVADLVLLRAARDYTEVHIADGRTQTIKEPLHVWEARLPSPPFARAHRSHLLNLDYVESLSQRTGAWFATLRALEIEVAVSRRLAGSLKERFATPRP